MKVDITPKHLVIAGLAAGGLYLLFRSPPAAAPAVKALPKITSPSSLAPAPKVVAPVKAPGWNISPEVIKTNAAGSDNIFYGGGAPPEPVRPPLAVPGVPIPRI